MSEEYEKFLNWCEDKWTLNYKWKKLLSKLSNDDKDFLKDQYEARLKADKAAMLTEIRDEIASNYLIDTDTGKIISGELRNFEAQILLDNLKNEIDKLKENINK